MRIVRIMIYPNNKTPLPMEHVLSAATRDLPTSSKSRAATLDSATLLGGRNEVEIIHQGETYRLRRTRQGKLILTK